MRKEIRAELERDKKDKRLKLFKKQLKKGILTGKDDGFAKDITHHLIICPHRVDDVWNNFANDISRQMEKIFFEIDKCYLGPNYRRKYRSITTYIGCIENMDKNNPHLHIALSFKHSDNALVKLLNSYLKPIFNRVDICLVPVTDTIEDRRYVLFYALKDYSYNSLRKGQDIIFSRSSSKPKSAK